MGAILLVNGALSIDPLNITTLPVLIDSVSGLMDAVHVVKKDKNFQIRGQGERLGNRAINQKVAGSILAVINDVVFVRGNVPVTLYLGLL